MAGYLDVCLADWMAVVRVVVTVVQMEQPLDWLMVVLLVRWMAAQSASRMVVKMVVELVEKMGSRKVEKMAALWAAWSASLTDGPKADLTAVVTVVVMEGMTAVSMVGSLADKMVLWKVGLTVDLTAELMDISMAALMAGLSVAWLAGSLAWRTVDLLAGE